MPPFSATIAATRFGLGAQPGEIAEAAHDPAGFLVSQIRESGADQVKVDGDGLGARMAIVAEYDQRKKALKDEERARFGTSGKISGVGSDSAAPPGPVNKKGKPVLDPSGELRIRPKRDAGVHDLHNVVVADARARLELAAETKAGFRERWAQFWINHFTVGSRKPQYAMLNAPYEREAIRPNVFGKFENLAFAVAHHPAMLLFLSQPKSVGPNSAVGQRKGAGLNENLARETLELHTLGAESGYTQADVTEFARALTGFSVSKPDVEAQQQGGFYFIEEAHEPGVRTIMGRRYEEPGEAQADAILKTIATDPRTAAHISRKLAAYFVADDPSPGLVATLERSWVASRGDLAQVAHALVTSSSAWDPAPTKFKTPYEYMVSCFRAGGLADDEAALGFATLERLGQPPFNPPSPKGWPDEAEAWATSNAIMERLQFANMHALRAAPQMTPAELAQQALGERATPALKAAMERANDRAESLTILFMSPEFQRR